MSLNWLRDAEETAKRQDDEITASRETEDDESGMPAFMRNWN